MTDTLTDPTTRPLITGGVDTHKDIHVAAALDERGQVLGTKSFPATPAGYRSLHGWLAEHGPVAAIGIEGTSSYGVNLTRHLATVGVAVVEVARPNRQLRRRDGKSDTIDAIAAARAVQAGQAVGIPKSADGPVEAIRALRVARRGAMKARTQAGVQLHNLLDVAPEDLRAGLVGLPLKTLVIHAARFRPGADRTLINATKTAMASVARRWQAANAEVQALDQSLKPLVAAACPALIELPAVGTDSAGALLVAAGDNPARLGSDAAFAKVCGVSPLPASSGRIVRHRLNKGGNREANSALWRIVLVRLRSHQPTKDYMARRSAEGLSKREIMRCLKRYVAREVFNALTHPAGKGG